MTKSPKTRTTKKDQLIRLLGARSGRSADILSKKLEWQPHTVRAAVSGLRKAGFEVACETQSKGGTKYRILAAPDKGVDQPLEAA